MSPEKTTLMNIEKSIMSMAASKSKGWNKNMEMEKGDANQAIVVFFFWGGVELQYILCFCLIVSESW